MSRPQRIAAIAGAALVALVVVYAVVGFLVVPSVLESQVQAAVSDELSLEASFERVSFNPFAMRLEVDGFAMGRPGEEPVASLGALRVDVEALRLPATRVIFSEIVLEAPQLTLQISEAGDIELAGVALGGDEEPAPEEAPGLPESPEAEPEPESDGEAPVSELRIEALALRGGEFRVRDFSRDPAFVRDLDPIDLEADSLDLTDLLRERSDEQSSAAQLSFGLGDGATLSARGGLDVDPMELDLELALSGLPLSVLQPYVTSFSDLLVRSGVLDASGRLKLRAQDDDEPDFIGELHVADLRLDLPDAEQPTIAWKQLDVRGIEVAPGEVLSLTFGEVDLAEPTIRLVQGPKGLDLALAFERDEPAADQTEPEEEPAVEEGPEEESPPPSIAVGPIAVSSGRVRFEDRTIKPTYGIDLEELKLDVDGFRTEPGSRSKVNLGAEIDGYAPVVLEGVLEPLAPRSYFDMRFSAKRLELEPFSPYTGRYVGRKVEAGRGSVEIDMNVVRRSMETATTITVDGFRFGEDVESADATSLPVASAVSMLQDSDGRILVEVPVAGSFDDPSFSYVSALGDALGTLVTRIVATPYKLVGGMISYGGQMFRPEEMSAVGFAAGSPDLSGAEAAKVDAIAAALLANPDLELLIQGGAAQSVDGRENLGTLARRRGRAIRDRLEGAGVSGERLRAGEVKVDEEMALEGGRVAAHVEMR